jgi:hypothetical protein
MLLVLVACLLLAANAQDSQDNCPAQPCRTATLEGGKCVYSVVPAGSSCSAVDPVTLKPVNGFCSSSGFCQTSCPVIQCQTATLFSFGCSYSPKSVGSACQNTSTSGSALGSFLPVFGVSLLHMASVLYFIGRYLPNERR